MKIRSQSKFHGLPNRFMDSSVTLLPYRFMGYRIGSGVCRFPYRFMDPSVTLRVHALPYRLLGSFVTEQVPEYVGYRRSSFVIE